MQSKQFWLLILLFLYNHVHAGNAEEQTRCERKNGIYALDKKTLSWGCHTLAYSIGDRAETNENRKKCEYADKVYGWNGSQYDCFFPNQINIQLPIASTPLQTHTNATLERRALCEQNGNAFIWNGEENTWTCHPIAYRINDKRINTTNQSSCESYGNHYLWDGQFYHCIGTKPITPPKVEIKPNETLIRRETCEQKGDIFEWNGTKNQWECIAKQTAQERKFLEQRKQACENLKKVFIWNNNANDWECLPTSVFTIPNNETQEKRTLCEQRGLTFAWNGDVNSWQCFENTELYSDYRKDDLHSSTCAANNNYYLEADNTWQCLKLFASPENKKINNAELEYTCSEYSGTLHWIDHRWTCVTKSTKEEIEKALTPSFKSPIPLTPTKSKFKIVSHIPDYVYGMAFTPDQHYLMTRTRTNSTGAIHVYNVTSHKETFTLSIGLLRNALFYKDWIILYNNKEPFEIWNVKTKKMLYSLPYEHIDSVTITESADKLLLFNNKQVVCWDLKNNKMLYTIDAKSVKSRSYEQVTILPEDTPFYYTNLNGQAAAINVNTGQDITPTPIPFPKDQSVVSSPKNLPSELNATRNRIYYSPDHTFAMETTPKNFTIWNLKSGTSLYTYPITIQNYETPVLTNTLLAFHYRTSFNTSALYLIEFARPEKPIHLNYQPIPISAFSESNKRNKPISTLSFDIQNTTFLQPIKSPKIYNETIDQTRYFSDGKRVVFGTRGNQVILYDLEMQKELARFGGGQTSHPTSSIQVELSQDESKIIATANLDRNIMVWDINQFKLDYTIPNPGENSNLFQLSSDGQYIISLNRLPDGSNIDGHGWRPEQGTINIWNIKTGILFRSLPRLATTFALIPDTQLIVLGENDGTVSFWDIRNGLEYYRMLGHAESIQSLDVLPNKHQLLSRDRQNNAILWDNIQNEPIGSKMLHGIPYQAPFSHNGNYMLITQEEYKNEGKIRLLNLKTSQYEYEFAFPISSKILQMFSDDDRYFFLSTPENATKVFETATGKELATLQAYDNGEWIILTPQGYFNASANARMFLTDSSGSPIDDATYQTYFKPDDVKKIINGIQK